MAPRSHKKQSKERNYWTKGELKHLEGFVKQVQDNGEAVDLQLLIESRKEYALLNNEIFPRRTPKALELKVYACFQSLRGGTTVVRNRAPETFNPQCSQEESMETDVDSEIPSTSDMEQQMDVGECLKLDQQLVRDITDKYNEIKRTHLHLSKKYWDAWCALNHKYQVQHPNECLEIIKQDIKAVRKMGKVRKLKDKLKKIHSLTGKRVIKSKKCPIEINPDRLRAFWLEIVGKEKPFEVSERFKEWFDHMETLEREQDNSSIATEFMLALKKVKPWKAAGPDGIQAYCVNGMMFNHQYYMDDLILYAKLREIVYAVKLVKTISAEVGLDMNMKKCAINIDKSDNDIEGIPCLSEIQVYKYLGIHCNEQTQQSVTREIAMKTLQGKKYDILDSEASYKQKRLLYNSQLIPKLSYISTNVIAGSGTLMSDLAQMEEFDKGLPLWLREKDRKLMQLSANSNRLFLPVDMGGLGFKSAREDMCKQIARCYTYIKFHRDLREIDELLESLAKRQKRNTISDFRQMLNICQGLNLNIECSRGNYIKVNGTCFLTLKKAVQTISKTMDKYFAELRLEQWQSKQCAGDVLREEDINIAESFRYLKLDFGIGPILNGMAVQEKAIMCYAHPANAALLDRKCRRCRQHKVLKPQLETIQHIMTGCPIGQVTTMVTRHDDVVKHLVQELRKEYNFKKLHYTEHIPKSDISECRKYKMFVDCPQPVTSEIISNKPDIVLETDDMVYIIEIGISWFTILSKQSRWKYCKYALNSTIKYEDFDYNQGEAFVSAESLKNRLKDLFRKEVKVIPLVLGVCGEITDQTLDFYKQLPLPANRIDKVRLLMQRSVMLGSHYVLKSHMGTGSCANKP
uniref:Reverse transcriptase domain-containing protein n=1 Tax=Panagrolaimus sp. JU765 TaxID=591449 RepID=A0AC34RKR5_9BILA